MAVDADCELVRRAVTFGVLTCDSGFHLLWTKIPRTAG
jgi:hypothetical protein